MSPYKSEQEKYIRLKLSKGYEEIRCDSDNTYKRDREGLAKRDLIGSGADNKLLVDKQLNLYKRYRDHIINTHKEAWAHFAIVPTEKDQRALIELIRKELEHDSFIKAIREANWMDDGMKRSVAEKLKGELLLQDNSIERDVFLAVTEAREARKGDYSTKIGEQQPIIFISCGQSAPEEKQLGKTIATLVESFTPFKAFFAENVTSLDGLTSSIFGNIDKTSGFIFVMHKRGDVKTRSRNLIRASVWIEQEIAIASFLQQIYKKKFHIAAYIQDGIKREGVRDVIHLNPRTFSDNSEILDHLKATLPTWCPIPAGSENSGLKLEAFINYSNKNITSQRHDYVLTVGLVNNGIKKIEDFRLDVEVPRDVLNKNAAYAIEINTNSKTHRLFRASQKEYPHILPLYKGDKRDVMKIEYYIDDELYDSGNVLSDVVRATVYTGDMEPYVIEKAISELNIF